MGVGVPLVASIVTPLLLGTLTVIRQSILESSRSSRTPMATITSTDKEDTTKTSENDEASSSSLSNNNNDNKSTLLIGRVWHTRFHPTRHGFSYPLFMFGVHLNDNDDDDNTLNRQLWPLSTIMHFSTKHHLINGEGKKTKTKKKDSNKQSNNNNVNDKSDNDHDYDDDKSSLRDRIFALIEERTNGYLRPSAETHEVWLVTHLSYYGYCFNPVSFYYLFHRHTGRMQAIVAEVSNTPWMEMYAYVLHPTSQTDRVKYTRITRTEANGNNAAEGVEGEASQEATNYKFPKTFHVSPFMEMEYIYDWTFAGEDKVFHGDSSNNTTMRVTTAMKRPDGKTQFTATMQLQRAGLRPLVLAWQLARYPSYCFIIQLWIHYEAFWLFIKGIAYQPHPQGSETTASRIIGAIMTPFFELQAWLTPTQQTQ